MSKTKEKEVEQDILEDIFDTDTQIRFKLENPAILKTSVEAFSSLTEEVIFKFDDMKMMLNGMDPSRVGVYRFEMDKECFDEYEFNYRDELKIGLNLEDFGKILKRIGAKESIEFSFSEKTQRAMIKMQTEEGKTRKFNIAALELEQEDIPLTNLLSINFTTKFTIDPDFIVEAIKDAEIYSEIIEMKASKKLVMRSWGQVGEMEYTLTEENLISWENEETDIGAYSITYLKAFLKLAPITEKLNISLKSDFPLKMFFELLEGAKVYCFTASRVEEADFEDDDDEETEEEVSEEPEDEELFDEEESETEE